MIIYLTLTHKLKTKRFKILFQEKKEEKNIKKILYYEIHQQTIKLKDREKNFIYERVL